jgi:acetyltransferase
VAVAGVHALLHPANVAVVGASTREDSMGFGVLECLQLCAFAGPVYPVNARYGEIAGRRCYPSLAELPERPDHVVIVVPAANVVDVVREAIAAGARSATIMSSGFERAGDAGRAALSELLRSGELAVSGPNCMGNFCAGAHFMTLEERRIPLTWEGSVAIAGQSGGIVMALYRSLWDRGITSSYVVTTGDELGLNAADYIEYFATRDDVRAILYYLEGVREPERFARAVRSATRAGKRVVLFAVGASERGREAAALHTGSAAGTFDELDALIAPAGAVRVDTLDEAVEATEFLIHAAQPRGPRIAAIVFSGGLKAIVCDCADRAGAELAELTPATLARLDALVSTGASVGNPLDFGPPGRFEVYLDCIRALRDDPNVDVVLVQDELLRRPGPQKEENFRRLERFVVEESGTPLALFAMISHSVTDHGRALSATLPHVPFLQEPAKAIRMLDKIGRAARAFRAAEA